MSLHLSKCCLRIIWIEPKPYGDRKSLALRAARIVATRAKAANERAQQRKQGMFLDGRSHFRFSLKRNFGIGWSRSLQILKHLEMHEYAPTPDVSPAFKEKVMKIAELIRKSQSTQARNT